MGLYKYNNYLKLIKKMMYELAEFDDEMLVTLWYESACVSKQDTHILWDDQRYKKVFHENNSSA